MNLVISCVTENRPAWFAKTLNLVLSVRAFGGAMADAPVVVNVVGGIDRKFADDLARLGAEARVVAPVSETYRYANKLRMFELAAEREFDVLVGFDCDVVVVGDFSHLLDPTRFRAKPADWDFLSDRQWRRLFEAVGLHRPAKTVITSARARPTYPYFNSGVLMVPGAACEGLLERWRRYVFELQELYDRSPDLAVWRRYNDQLALTCAVVAADLPIHPLPVGMNVPTHTVVHPSLAPGPGELYAIHYHTDIDRDGFLLSPRDPVLARAIDAFNRRRALELGVPYRGPVAPPAAVRLKRWLASHDWFHRQAVERAKLGARRLLAPGRGRP